MNNALWTNCLQRLEQELSDQQLNTWIRPLQVREDPNQLTLLAPNRFVLDWVKQNYLDRIIEVAADSGAATEILVEVGSRAAPAVAPDASAPAPAGGSCGAPGPSRRSPRR